MNIESVNKSELSAALQSLLIRHLANKEGFDLMTAIKIVNSTDLEKAFLADAVADLAARCRIIEKLFDQNYQSRH